MYATFKCRKCGHLLRRDGHTMDSFMYFFEDLCKEDCPNCGEEGHENWILRSFVVEDTGQQNYGHIDYELEEIERELKGEHTHEQRN